MPKDDRQPEAVFEAHGIASPPGSPPPPPPDVPPFTKFPKSSKSPKSPPTHQGAGHCRAGSSRRHQHINSAILRPSAFLAKSCLCPQQFFA